MTDDEEELLTQHSYQGERERGGGRVSECVCVCVG